MQMPECLAIEVLDHAAVSAVGEVGLESSKLLAFEDAERAKRGQLLELWIVTF